MKITEMLERYSMLDSSGQERLMEEFVLQSKNGDTAALYLTGYLAVPLREDVMISALKGNDPELLLAYADYCAHEYGGTAAGRRKVSSILRKAGKCSCAPLLNRLGILTAAGCGCAQNLSRAEEYFRKAALLGSAEAEENLKAVEELEETPEQLSDLPQKKVVTAELLKPLLKRPGRMLRIFRTRRPAAPFTDPEQSLKSS